MNAIRVDKSELLAILKQNREKHAAVVAEVFENYRATVIAELDKALALAKSGKALVTNIHVVQPQDMTKAYDRVIGMLELSLDDVVKLEENEYMNYVLDIWSWSRQFSSTSSSYSTSSASSTYLAEIAERVDAL